MAGLIDGEGGIRIEKGGNHTLPSTPTLSLTNSSAKMIEWVYERFGGHIYKKKNRTCWDIFWLGKDAERIIKLIYPYLTAKKPQADIVLAYRKLIGKVGKRVDDETRAKRLVLVEAMSILKRKKEGLQI